MAGSPVDALSPAIERSQQLLFRSFKADRWFALGFTVFLAQCGEGDTGSSVTAQVPNLLMTMGSGPGAPTDFHKMLQDALQSARDNLGLYALIAVGVMLLALALWLCIAWFSSRAKLMLVESVVHERVDVSAQWSHFAVLGMSLFKCRVVLSVCAWTLGLGSIAAAVAVAYPDLDAGRYLGTRAVIGYAIFAASSVFLGIPFALATAILDDFVVPLMAVRSLRVLDAWGVCRAEVLSGNVGSVVLFYLLRILLAAGIAIAMEVLKYMTCCISTVPYLGTVLLLPIFVFNRGYSLYFMEQLGVSIFPRPEGTWAAYDQWRFPR